MKKVLGFFSVLGILVLGSFPSIANQRWPVTRSEIIPDKESFALTSPGQKSPVPYETYGRFVGENTPQYLYMISDRPSLARAVGEGVYPNTEIYRDSNYKDLLREGKLRGSLWHYVDTPTSALNFYKWATAPESPGVRQFYTAIMLERLGLIKNAIDGFYAVALHFPRTVSYTYFDTPWFVAPAALDRMEQLLRRHPQLGLQWSGGAISIEGKYSGKAVNNVIRPNPGRLIPAVKHRLSKGVNLSKLSVIKTVGGPKIQLKEYANHHWQLFVDSQPFTIKAINYSVTPIGRSPDRATWNVSKDWQLLDSNHNNLHDGFFESYIDKNDNGIQDADEPTVGDARLLKDLGANTLRAYHHLYTKDIFRRLYREYGFYVLCGDILGGYAVDSGATWADGTDYRNPEQQERMLASVRRMVEDYRNEPYILMWVLGNENVYGVANNSGKYPEAFFELVDRAAQLIHQLDPSRPVALADGDLLYLNLIRDKCPHIDVMGANVYRGEQGFGRSLFQDVRDQLDRPFLVTEFGAPAIAEGYSQKEAEAYQAMYIANNWEDLEAHHAGHGVGNTLGGVLFEFIDEWWKANSDLPEKVQKQRAEWYAPKSAIYKSLQPENHDEVPQFGGPFLDGWSYEEWFGLASQGSGRGSPFARILRPAYYRLKDLWNPK